MKTYYFASKHLLLLPALLLGHLATHAQGIGIGTTTPAASAALEIQSTTQGLLLPRLTLAQRNTLTSSTTAPPVAGLVIFQTDNTPGFYAYDGTGWVRLAADNLGNHTATQSLNLQANALTGTGASIGTAVGVGVRADGGLNLGQNTSGSNISLGYQAGQAITTGSSNLFSGYQAGQANTTGINNVFSGYQAGKANLGGGNNVFSGYQAGQANTGGGNNLFSGSQSGYSNLTGNNNLFSGSQSGYNNLTGGNNVFSGLQSGFSNLGGGNNVFNGTQSGYGSTSGNNNVFSGTNSGYNNVSGSGNTAIGFNSGPSTGALSNATALGANAVVSQSNSLVLGNGANVGIGTSAPGQKLEVAGVVYSSTGGFMFPNGSVQTAAATDNQALSLNGNTLSLTNGGSVALPGGDNLGSHVATQKLDLATFPLVGNGGSTGLSIAASGTVSAGADVVLAGGATTAYKYATAHSYTQHYGLSDLRPENSSSQGTTFNATTDNFYATTAGAIFRLPLHLPQGATLTSMSFYYFDTSTADLTADLITYNPATDTRTSISTTTTAGGSNSGAGANVTSFVIGAPVIDNSRQTYSLRITFGAGANNLTFRGFSVTYTVLQAD